MTCPGHTRNLLGKVIYISVFSLLGELLTRWRDELHGDGLRFRTSNSQSALELWAPGEHPWGSAVVGEVWARAQPLILPNRKQKHPLFFTCWLVFMELERFNTSEAAVNVTEMGHYRVWPWGRSQVRWKPWCSGHSGGVACAASTETTVIPSKVCGKPGLKSWYSSVCGDTGSTSLFLGTCHPLTDIGRCWWDLLKSPDSTWEPLVMVLWCAVDFHTGTWLVLCKEMHSLARGKILRGTKSGSAASDTPVQQIQVPLHWNLQDFLSRSPAQLLTLERGSKYIEERFARMLPVVWEFACSQRGSVGPLVSASYLCKLC